MIGPGKYDNYAAELMRLLKAEGIILAVIKGAQGSGCSIKITSDAKIIVPKLLRQMADEMESVGN